MKKKHLFSNGVERVIAENSQQATQLWEEWSGMKKREGYYGWEWQQIPDDADVVLNLSERHLANSLVLPKGAVVLTTVTAPAREWVAVNPPGFLATTKEG